MLNIKMEPRLSSGGQVFQRNAREDKKLNLQINEINSAKKEQLGKIDQEMMSLKKQLLEDRKILGTRSNIKRREDRNAKIFEENCDEKPVRNSVQPKLIGLQKPTVIERKSFKPFQDRSRQLAMEQHEFKLSSPRVVSVVHEETGNFRRRLAQVQKQLPSCSTPSPRYLSRRHSIAAINFSNSLSNVCEPQTSLDNAPKNTHLSGRIAGAKVDHILLRQRRASLSHTLTPNKVDHPVDLPKLKPLKLVAERNKQVAVEESRVNKNVKVGNFSRHAEDDLRLKRSYSLPNSFPLNRDSVACKERLTAKLVSRIKPVSASNKNTPTNKRTSVFGRHFQKSPTPVTERSNEGEWIDQEDNDSLERLTVEVVENDDKEQEAENEQKLSSECELSFIPKLTLQEKMNKFFLERVEDSDEVPRTGIEQLLQEFRKEKKEGRRESIERIDEESISTAQEW